MINYFFCVTYGDHWLETVIKLHKNKIAKPVLWLGDYHHFSKAADVFGDVVQDMEKLVHHPYTIESIEYNNEYVSFFDSIHYLRSKDRCLKMMDRLDLFGNFNRLDREAYFHNLVLYFLKYTFDNKPDLFLSTDAPHSHAQYLLYEICLYLKIPTYKFNNFVFIPLLFIEEIKTGKRFEFKKRIKSENINLKIQDSISKFILDLKDKKEKYTIFYVANQEAAKKIIPRFKTFLRVKLKNDYKEIKHFIGLFIRKKTSYINPYRLSFFVRKKIKRIKKKRLLKVNNDSSIKMDYVISYVYYPLHYEPERTTNPDGGEYQDQLKALIKLRSIIPKEIRIVVKEHPFQFYNSDKGSRGRSPLFYKLIKNIENVDLIQTSENTVRLILNSLFVATITGTVALEASILGKNSLYFGNPWFKGLPNTYSIKEEPSFELLASYVKYDSDHISNFLINIFKKHSVLAYMNFSQKEFFKNDHDELISKKSNDLYYLLEEFFKTKSKI